jgi:hypothetical protein
MNMMSGIDRADVYCTSLKAREKRDELRKEKARKAEAKARAVTMSERTSMGLAGVDLDPVHRPGESALLRTVD